MIAYFKGGSLNGRARQDVNKKTESIQIPMKDGSVEWYRKIGKKVHIRQGKESLPARVFTYSNTVLVDDNNFEKLKESVCIVT